MNLFIELQSLQLFRFIAVKTALQYTDEHSSWMGYAVSSALIIASSLNKTLQSPSFSDMSCLAELREGVFNQITDTTHHILIENTTISISFINRSYADGYTVKAYQVNGSTTTKTDLGRSSRSELILHNSTIPASLQSTAEQRTCSQPCPGGLYREFYDIQNLPCCWTCKTCIIHWYSPGENSNACSECLANQTNNSAMTGCVSSGIDYLKFSSSRYLILGLVCIAINVVVIVVLIAYCIVMAARPVIKATDPVFLVIFLVGLMLGNFGLFFTLVKPSPTTCQLEFTLLTTSFTIVTSSLALRALKIYSIFSAANNFKSPRFGAVCTRKGQLAMNSGILLVNITITLLVVTVGDGWHYLLEQEAKHGTSYLMCTTRSLYTAIPFVIPTLLFLSTLYFAFIMRHFPHNFRETTSIFASTLIALCSASMFLTGYNLSPPSVKSILRALMVYITIVAFLSSIFVPKLVVIMRAKNVTDEKEFINSGIRQYTASTKPLCGSSKKKTPVSSEAKEPLQCRQESVKSKTVAEQEQSLLRVGEGGV